MYRRLSQVMRRHSSGQFLPIAQSKDAEKTKTPAWRFIIPERIPCTPEPPLTRSRTHQRDIPQRTCARVREHTLVRVRTSMSTSALSSCIRLSVISIRRTAHVIDLTADSRRPYEEALMLRLYQSASLWHRACDRCGYGAARCGDAGRRGNGGRFDGGH